MILWLKTAQNLQPTVVSQSFLNTETWLEDDKKTIDQL